jgi:NMD protein affecting ribosome stability and mRNA decay
MVKTLQGRPKGYYEAVIQLRDLAPEEVHRVIGKIEFSDRAVISKITDYSNGVDIYISDRHYANILAKWLVATFHGELKESRKLHSLDRQTQKAKWRVTVFFRKLPFKVNDVIETDEGPARILAMKKKAHVKYLKTGKTRIVPFDVLVRYAKPQ